MALPLCFINTIGWDFLFIVASLLALFIAPPFIEFFPISKTKYKKYISKSLIPRTSINLKTILLSIILILLLKTAVTSLFNTPFQGFSHILCSLDAVTLGPIAEELFFRGVVLSLLLLFFNRYLENKNAETALGLIISSLLFVLVHGNFAPEQILLKFFGGTIFGYAYLANDRNITAPILVHLAGNLFVLLMTIV